MDISDYGEVGLYRHFCKSILNPGSTVHYIIHACIFMLFAKVF